jgi:hypothetical protein
MFRIVGRGTGIVARRPLKPFQAQAVLAAALDLAPQMPSCVTIYSVWHAPIIPGQRCQEMLFSHALREAELFALSWKPRDPRPDDGTDPGFDAAFMYVPTALERTGGSFNAYREMLPSGCYFMITFTIRHVQFFSSFDALSV